ncbi:hypothetical protein [Kitasatospora sp. NPDC058218]|uniref:hypothetical protein n=1 Tax=Kitasatospora sp. NPDC058218 TaxID=3346385 RepID=UPI0036DE8A31
MNQTTGSLPKTTSLPTAEEVMALVRATPDPRTTALTVLDVIRALDGGPITENVVRYLPLAGLLDRVGLEFNEVELADLPDYLRGKFSGMLLQHIDGHSMIVMPADQDPHERDQIARQLIWRHLVDPVCYSRPIHLPATGVEAG